ncbi:glycosyltransferase [Chondromyces apiculatus]|uniref:Glycosyl transferase, group 2 family protein n=1 Tax=Chondromyces apiculatus DSM 436 TaxID=1192034 RepID=A0A017T072_9BACT|nr:glycosyltransferase [Chondromyces apiculatus]EYF02260.1 Glycosyl transferase, group 2 family protein [Chondromyces apiculatus DSM 436]
MHPLVSVLLPYRNAGRTVEEALGSVLSERGVPLEVVAVDDGSTDDGPEVVAGAAARDARVVPVASGGVGIARALSQAASVARGELLARMDADDVSVNERLRRQAEALREDAGLGVVGARVEAFATGAEGEAREVGEGMRRYVDWLNGIVTPEDHAREMFVESPLCHPSVMMRREVLASVGGFQETRWAEDYDLWLRMAAAGVRMAKIPEVGLRWRHQTGRATFSDPRYAIARFLEAKGHYLAARLRKEGRRVAVWGAGRTGRRLAAALRENGVFPCLFVDIDPRKIGRSVQGAPIVEPGRLERGVYALVVAVGARGARALIREHLGSAGFTEGEDYVCAS